MTASIPGYDAWKLAGPYDDAPEAGPCPKCASAETDFRSGGLDVTVRECVDCGHQWDHT